LKQLLAVFGIVDKMNEFIAKLFSWSIVVLVLTMTYEVIMRYGFNKPTAWNFDMAYFLSSILLMAGMAYTMKIKGHVNIDIFYGNFPQRVKALLDIIFALILFFPMWYLIIKVMFPNVIFSYNMAERSTWGMWLPIIWPFKGWVLIGTIMLLVQGIVEFLRDVIWVIKGGERP
jgi:TRAP-type mannitol/chloroaromatic compound transport system permease small subunit